MRRGVGPLRRPRDPDLRIPGGGGQDGKHERPDYIGPERARQLGQREGDCRLKAECRWHAACLSPRDRNAPAAAPDAVARRDPLAGEGDRKTRTARGMLVSRGRDAPPEAGKAAALRCPPPAQLESAVAYGALRSRPARSRRAIGDALRDGPRGAALRWCGWESRRQSADCTMHARRALLPRAGGSTQCRLEAFRQLQSADCTRRSSRANATRRRQHAKRARGAPFSQRC